MADDFWIERAQSAEAKLETLKGAYEPAIEKVQAFKATFGVREDSEGKLHVNYDRFAEAIGIDGALELRRIIDERYQISGEAGEKPRVKVSAVA